MCAISGRHLAGDREGARVISPRVRTKAIEKARQREREAYDYYLRVGSTSTNGRTQERGIARQMFIADSNIDPDTRLLTPGSRFVLDTVTYGPREFNLGQADIASKESGSWRRDLARVTLLVYRRVADEKFDEAKRSFETRMRSIQALRCAYFYGRGLKSQGG